MTISNSARAKRARDHLARKRRQERNRLERERWRTENSESRAQFRGILAPILFGLALIAGIAVASPVVEVFVLRQTALERVAVQGASSLSPLVVAASAGVVAGRSLDEIDPGVVRETVASNPWIESARALRLPTGTLVVSIVEKRAVARWQLDDSRDVELIDQRGERFAGSIAPAGPLPLVRGAIENGAALPASAIEILDQLKQHMNLVPDPSLLTLYLPDRRPDAVESRSGYVLEIGEGGPRALLGQRLLSQRVARLAALLESDEAQLAHARWIDLRYADRAVLRAEPVSG
jgi:cell division septal protein FtsQ